MAVAISRTVITTNGQSRVSLTVTGDPGTFTITRTISGVTVPVRYAEDVNPVLPFTVIDWEAPAGSAVYTVTSTAGTASTAATTVPASDCVWLVPLVNPDTGSLKVILEEHGNFGPSVMSDVVQPLGGGPAVVVTFGKTAESGDVTLRTLTTADYNKLNALVGQPLWISHDPTHGWGPFYAVLLPGASSRWINVSTRAERRIPLAYYVQDRPEVTSSGVVTWLDVEVRFPGIAGFDNLQSRYGTFDAFWADAENWTS